MSVPLRIIFAGSPGIAVPSLESLAELTGENSGFELAGVLTNPDSPRGRHGRAEPTEVGAAAAILSEKLIVRGKPPLVIIKALTLDARIRAAVGALKPDLLVSFAYGRIFGPKFLALFPLGGINIHPSLLPKYRGAAPVPAAILHRESKTGISIQRLAAEMDSGEILAQEEFFLTGRETTETLSNIMAWKAAALLPETVRGLASGTIVGYAQNHGDATYCSLISKEDGRIDWGQSAADIDARIRAFTPWPLCWTKQGGEYLYILEAAPWEGPEAGTSGSVDPGRVLGVDKGRGILIQTGDGVLLVTSLQYRARKALDWQAFLNGARGFTGSRLG
ncbi:MAG: methionyl-tRNA formyltransferase [Spirochaetaceae bacterium]|jgi:methionyl-tRNA formyltransferase|nr:methionyl-tRNA formyltransferase [Spirochaetaceae bacterium]